MSKASEGFPFSPDTDPRLDRIADELEGAGWPDYAADIRAGTNLDRIIERLVDDGQADSEAFEIVTWKPA